MLKTYYELLDPDHALITLFAIIAGIAIAGGEIIQINLIYAAITSFSIIGAAFIINDYWDLETDKKNKRTDKPMVRGEVSKKIALILTINLIILGNTSAYLININTAIITIVFTGILLAYSYYLKKIALVGNIAIAASMAIPFIFGNYIVSENLNEFVIILAAMAFFMGIGREIIGSIRDKKGDARQGRKTLPIIIGDRKSALLAALFIFIAISLSPIPFISEGIFFNDYYYLALVLVTDLILIFSSIKAVQLKSFKLIRKTTLIAQLTGVLGFLLGAVF